MNDKLIYSILNTKLNIFSKNLDSILFEITKFEKNCSNALVLNGETSYKNSIVNIKNNLNNQKQKVNNEILLEIKQKI